MSFIDMNTTTLREYIGEIERGIYYLKERTRCVVKTLSAVGICYVPRQIVIHVVYNVTTFVNTLPISLGVSAMY